MNTEQLKTDSELVAKKIISVPDNKPEHAANHKLREITEIVYHFASQESKRAVEKDRESRWISVKERLPENKIWVIVWIPQRGMSFMAYRAGEMWESDLLGLNTVNTATHWQPLPEPPKL